MNRIKRIALPGLMGALFLLMAGTGRAQTSNRVLFNGQELFLNGANVPWDNFSDDVGPDAHMSSGMAYFSGVFNQVHANGGNCMRLWLHTNGAYTPAWNGDVVTGPGDDTISDLQEILNCAWTNQVGIDLCLWSFDMMDPEYNTNYPGLTDRSSAILTNATYRGDYITNCLIPMVSALKGNPAIVCWEIFNEPEGMTTQFGWTGAGYEVDMTNIMAFVNLCAGAIHRTDPSAKVSNGAWSFYSTTDVTVPGSPTPSNHNYYRDDRLIAAGGDPDGTLDFYMVHYYDWAGTTRDPFNTAASYWELTKPLVVAEFYPNSSDGCSNCGSGTAPYGTIYANGYAGALTWAWNGSSQSVISDMLAEMASIYDADPAAVVVVVATNNPPTVALTTPTNGEVYASGASVSLAATATAPGSSTITNVQFYQGNTLIGRVNTSPYLYTWTSPPAAVYQLTAVATDNEGESATSSPPVSITVGNLTTETLCAADATLSGNCVLESDPTACSGEYVNMDGSPAALTWTITGIPSAGNYDMTIGYELPFGDKTQYLTVNDGSETDVSFGGETNTWITTNMVVALDAGNNTIEFSAYWGYMYFNYIELALPSPTAYPPVFGGTPPNQTVTELTLLTVTNNAIDTNNPAQPLTYQLLNPPSGAGINASGVITWTPSAAEAPSTNKIVTVVSNNVAGATNSFQVVVVVATNNPPTVALTTPTNGEVYASGASVSLAATATAPGSSTITNVQFYQGNTLIGRVNTSPYLYTWTSPPAAVYQLTAVATDNEGESATSSPPVSITVGNLTTETLCAADATLSGNCVLESDPTACSGEYVNMDGSPAALTWTITGIPSAGNYDMTIGYELPFGDKTQYLTVNDGSETDVSFGGETNTWITTNMVVALDAGNNTIEFSAYWGYMYFNYIAVSTQPPALTIGKSGGNVVLTWSGGTLRSSATVNGAYTPVPSAVSPYTNATAASQKFYRVSSP